MASNLVKAPTVVVQQARQMAAQAATRAKASVANLPEPKMSKLDSGLTVVSVDAPHTNLCTVGVVVKSGPRYESYDNQGVSHAIRACAGSDTARFTQFAVMRNMQQAGGPLQCVQGREHFMYATQLHKDRLDDAVDFLLEAAGGQTFKPWIVGPRCGNNTGHGGPSEPRRPFEVMPEEPRLPIDLSQLEPGVKANELLHKAAYRTGLGYSLYSPEFMLGKHKPTMLQAFYNKTFTASRMALVGIGVDHQRLSSYAGQLNLESGEGPRGEGKYHGGELRQDAATGNKAIVSMAAECAGGNNIKEAIAAMLLQRIWGAGNSVRWGEGSGQLQKAVAESLGSGSSVSGPPTVEAFNFVYSDTGLLGAQVVADAEDAGKAVSAMAAAIRSSSVSAEQVEAAKKGLLLDAFEIILERSMSRCEDLGLQALIKKEIISPNRAPEVVNSVTAGDVQAVAKKVASSKLSLAAYGNLANVPYLDEL